MSLMTPMVVTAFPEGEGGVRSGKAKALQDSIVPAVGGIVGAVGVDAQLEGGDGREVYGVVLELFRSAFRRKGELLAAKFAKVAFSGADVDGELLRAVGGVREVQKDAMDSVRFVEVQADKLRTCRCGFPAFRWSVAQGVLDGEVRIFGGDFDASDGVEIKPGVFIGVRLCGCGGSAVKQGFAHRISNFLQPRIRCEI